MRDPNQRMRFNHQELSLLKSLFSEDDSLLYSIRKVMLQFPLTDAEQASLKSSMTDTVYILMARFFNPWLESDSPIHQMTSLLFNLGADIKGLSHEGAYPMIKAKEMELKYLDQQLAELKGKSNKPTVILKNLEDLKGDESESQRLYINTLVWNFLVSYIDSVCYQMKLLAGMKDESVEETQARLAKNSTK